MAQLRRVIHRRDALAAGMSRHQIDRRLAVGTWRRLLPCVYLTVDTLTWNDRLAAALLFGGRNSMLTGAAALSASEIRIAIPSRITVLTQPGRRQSPVDWVQLRRTSRLPEPLPWTGPRRARVERAVADLARDTDDLDLVRTVVARAVRSGWCSVDDIAREQQAGRRNGSALLRQALEEVTDGAASAPEARAARILRRHHLDGFEQNARIETMSGWFVADFLWRSRRAILEIDSVEHHLDARDWRATMDRHLALESLGYSVVHRPPSALADSAGFAGDIRTWLSSRPTVT